MPVAYAPLPVEQAYPVRGVRFAVAQAHIRKPDRDDVLLVVCEPGSRAAGVFTQSRFAAAPVQVCREHLQKSDSIRALLVNTGIANAATGALGLAQARQSCELVASRLGIEPQQVLPFSTGVILEHLPMDRLEAGIDQAVAQLKSGHSAAWDRVARAIMTTDTVYKLASRQIQIDGHSVNLTGIAKGAGMIQPNMATMLGFVFTDAVLAPELLPALVRRVADASFNRVTVDGDTSTNDSFLLVATGQAGHAEIRADESPAARQFEQALRELSLELAQAIVRDGEGATKFITVHVQGGRDQAECDRIARAVAHSPLVKTAFFASDPNLGRILAAVGYGAPFDLDPDRVRVHLDDVLVAEGGGRAASYREELGQAVMRKQDISIRIELGRGRAEATVYTCDFSYDYVRINADYRS